jgi:hypothetical protein
MGVGLAGQRDLDEAHAQHVAVAVIAFLDKAAVHQRADVAVEAGPRHAGDLGQIGDRDRLAGPGDGFEQQNEAFLQGSSGGFSQNGQTYRNIRIFERSIWRVAEMRRLHWDLRHPLGAKGEKICWRISLQVQRKLRDIP